jgi:hypothetical protein
MVDLGPIEEDVPFAWDAASKLKHAFLRTAEALEEQIPRRSSYGHHAKHDWQGRYAKVFDGDMSVTTGDAGRIAAELRHCAQMLGELAQLAREEQHRREIARAWKVKHDAWKADHADDDLIDDIGDLLGGDDEPKPPDLPEIKPHPRVAEAPPTRDRGH